MGRSLFVLKRGQTMLFRRHITPPVILTFIIAVVASAELSSARRPPAGSPRLIAYERLPEPDGDWCEWDVATLQALRSSKVAAFQASAPGQRADAPAGTCTEQGCAAVAARKPVRFVRDPYAGFSSVKVDPIRNEVILMDEFKFDILVYDRTVTTPPSATSTTPKRKIGGDRTKSQYNSDAYIDPKNGDLYVINNDSVPGLNVYSRQAQGNVPPDGELTTPYGGFGLAVDEEKQELFVTVQHDGAVMVFPKTARGDANPIRLIQGARTHMGDPHGIAVDPKNHLLFVANYGTTHQAVQGTLGGRRSSTTPRIPNWPAGNLMPYRYRDEVVLGTGAFGLPSITVFPMDAQGNATPVRVIEGPKTGLNWPTGIAVDPGSGEVYVANAVGDSIGVFSATAQGDVAPVRTLKGPRTLLKNPNGVFVDVAHDEVWVANFGNHLATAYTRTASGDTPPLRVIRSAPLDAPTTLINNPYMIAYDTKRDEILVPN